MSKIGAGVLYQTGGSFHILIKNSKHSYLKCRAGMKTGIETQHEFFIYFVEDPAAYMQERFSTRWIDEENGIQAIYGLKINRPETPTPVVLLFMRAKGWNRQRVDEWLRKNPKYLPKQLKEALRKYPKTKRKRNISVKRKKPPSPVIRLLPAPLSGNSTGFGKSRIGDSLYNAATDTVISKAALDSMKERCGRR